jgi:probable phosphoglycerate mutase
VAGGERARTLGITHIIASDLVAHAARQRSSQSLRLRRHLDSRLRELDMGVLEKRHIDADRRRRRLASPAG